MTANKPAEENKAEVLTLTGWSALGAVSALVTLVLVVVVLAIRRCRGDRYSGYQVCPGRGGRLTRGLVADTPPTRWLPINSRSDGDSGPVITIARDPRMRPRGVPLLMRAQPNKLAFSWRLRFGLP